jgi:hypothetical protein
MLLQSAGPCLATWLITLCIGTEVRLLGTMLYFYAKSSVMWWWANCRSSSLPAEFLHKPLSTMLELDEQSQISTRLSVSDD